MLVGNHDSLVRDVALDHEESSKPSLIPEIIISRQIKTRNNHFATNYENIDNFG